MNEETIQGSEDKKKRNGGKRVTQAIQVDFSLPKEEVQTLDFSMIFERYYKRLYNYFFYCVHNEYVTEDLVSQTFEKKMVNLAQYDSKKAVFEVWLFTIARINLNDYFRSQKRHPWTSIEQVLVEIAESSNPEEKVLLDEKEKAMSRAIRHLKDQEKAVIAYRFGAELKNKEIAKVMGMSERHVGMLIHRTLKKLRNYLIEEEA